MIKKHFTVILLMMIATITSYAQQNYIELESGERVYSNKIKFRGSLNMGNAELQIDNGKRYVVSYQVDNYFENGTQYKKGYLIGSQVPNFFKLQEEGPKVNLYFKTVMTMNSVNNQMQSSRIYYYSKKDSLMAPLKLKYELKDLADSPASMQILTKAKSKRTIASAFYITGSSLIVASIINFTSEQSESKTTGALFIAGGACFVLGVPFNNAKERKKLQAVRAYNK